MSLVLSACARPPQSVVAVTLDKSQLLCPGPGPLLWGRKPQTGAPRAPADHTALPPHGAWLPPGVGLQGLPEPRFPWLHPRWEARGPAPLPHPAWGVGAGSEPEVEALRPGGQSGLAPSPAGPWGRSLGTVPGAELLPQGPLRLQPGPAGCCPAPSGAPQCLLVLLGPGSRCVTPAAWLQPLSDAWGSGLARWRCEV